MRKTNTIAPQTRINWFIDVCLFIGAVIVSITSIYFLFLPTGGYQGGRNSMYGITILFARETWDDLHTWFGILMIAAALVHIIVHWGWIKSMGKRILREITLHETRFNKRSRFNLLINTAVGFSLAIVAISGVYLLFVPSGPQAITDPQFLFVRTTWDLVHTWSGILMITAAIIHFAIHWKWITKVTRKIVKSLLPSSKVVPSVKIYDS
jgi:preprotein translocase subunit SecY